MAARSSGALTPCWAATEVSGWLARGLPAQMHRQLDKSRQVGLHGTQLPKQRVSHVCRSQVLIEWMVQHIHHLEAELQPYVFVDREILRQRRIPVAIAGSANVAKQIRKVAQRKWLRQRDGCAVRLFP